MADQKWNYRVIKSGTDTETYFSIQEVFYDESYRKETDKSKAASNFDYSHTIECTPGGNSIDEVKEQLTRMLGCLEEPVLEEIPASQADMDPDEAIYYESTDGGKTLQAIDLDDMLEEEEETENVDRAVKDTDPIDEKALAEEKEKVQLPKKMGSIYIKKEFHKRPFHVQIDVNESEKTGKLVK